MKIYLINGDSYLLVNEKIDSIIKDNKNVSIFDSGVVTIEDLVLEAGYFSLFQEQKFIIYKNANFFGSSKISEKDTELLLNYLEKPNDFTTIIFVCNEKIDMRKKVTKIIKEKYSLEVLPSLKYYEIENKIGEYFKKNKFSIDNESLKYIVASSLNNYDISYSEASKIMLYYASPCQILYKDVINIVSKQMNSNNFLFVDSVVDGDLEKSLRLYKDLITLKVEPTILVTLLARDFRIIKNVKVLLDNKVNNIDILKMLGLQDWQLEKYKNKAFVYKIKDLDNIINKIYKLDLDIKSGKVDRFIGLELLMLDICE